MSLKVYNVLTGKKEDFVPREEGKVKMYACGITVSDNAHIGHAYQAIIFDMIRSYLEYIGNEVTYVRNYTDVDDKIIINARKAGINPKDFAEAYIKKTDAELDALNIKRPTIQARATENIDEMIEFISKLIEKGYAYATEAGDVYYRVNAFSDYGKFSNRSVDEQFVGVRKEVEAGKEDDRDFALWKNAGDDEIYWESPWGKGRPGWHIECSAMSMKYLGETLDIHGGGKDLKFPHHENEIAQSEALTGKQFANYWIHNGLVKVNGQKMSKSLGNGILIEDLIKKYNPDTVKMTILQNNYRSDLNIMDGMFEQVEEKIYNIYKLFTQIDSLGEGLNSNKDTEIYKTIDTEFRDAMDNDFNTSVVISNIFGYINTMNKLIDKKDIQALVDMKYAIKKIYKTFGLLQQEPDKVISEIKNKYLTAYNITVDEIESAINLRNEYKINKNYEGADQIRNELLEKGITIKDSREGTSWDIKF